MDRRNDESLRDASLTAVGVQVALTGKTAILQKLARKLKAPSAGGFRELRDRLRSVHARLTEVTRER